MRKTSTALSQGIEFTHFGSSENKPPKPIDMRLASISYLPAMKTKKQPTVFALRFKTKTEREIIRKAAQLEGRSMTNYIIRTVISKAAADIQAQADTALNNLS
ncbi:MAG TPA: DUF1778 domain-containing protein [Candidatus Dormibacteraeota bacterium]|nr:DUF1778 domain-containing protein [Candidatus Dormibacteraeota bacterium]